MMDVRSADIINHQSVVDENRKKFHVETFLAEVCGLRLRAVGTRNQGMAIVKKSVDWLITIGCCSRSTGG